MDGRSEDTKGWVISMAIHVLLLLILWLIKVPVLSLGPEFIEVSWSAVGMPPSSSVRGYATTPRGLALANPYSSTRVRLPGRLNLEPPDEILRMLDTEKLNVAEVPKPERELVDATGLGEKGLGIIFGEKEKIQAPLFAGKSRDIKPPFGASVGREFDRLVGFEVAWSAGGKRRLLSGKLPEYPAGVNLEAQIKIRAVVLPGGSVKSAQPIQKANMKLEEAALKEVRFWKFEPLASTHPQVDQTCTIIFNFLLR